MLLAYIDEIGEPGAFVSRDHERFRTSPAFGYAGFVIHERSARSFGQAFTAQKRQVFRTEVEAAASPGRWERKGSEIFRPDTLDKYPQQIRVFNGLVHRLRRHGGNLFYYANEKPLGTPKQTSLDVERREADAMRETLNRLARHADKQQENLLVLVDQVNEKQRRERVSAMYAHVFSRTSEFPEMTRIAESPMHIDSVLSAGVQFADWIAACLTRSIDYQLIETSKYRWVATSHALDAVRGAFTHESKLHLWNRSVGDLNHSEVFRGERPLYPWVDGHRLSSTVDPSIFRSMKAAAERAQQRHD